jgi:O-antigen biosynthesis protein
VDFASLLPPERPEQLEITQALGVKTLPWLNESARRDFLSKHSREYDIILFAWTTVARRFLSTVREAANDGFLIFDSYDVNHLREYRQARLTGNQNTLRRALLSREREVLAMRLANCTLAISEVDASVLHALDPSVSIAVLTMWCDPVSTATSVSANVLFLGHFGAAHNHDAAISLATQIWPRIRMQNSAARLILAGSDPDAAIMDLIADDIAVPGWTPDLLSLFANAAVFTAPLRFGSGIKGKMLQAMAHGVPIVASAIAAEGIGLSDGKDFLCADSAETTAAAIVQLLNDRKLAQTLATNGRALLQRRFSRSVVESQLDQVLARVTGGSHLLAIPRHSDC